MQILALVDEAVLDEEEVDEVLVHEEVVDEEEVYKEEVDEKEVDEDLTRFNKICHPSQRPRWQVDKEAIGLSRVQQCSSTYSLPS